MLRRIDFEAKVWYGGGMKPDASALIVLLLTSAVDWPWMVIKNAEGDERWPHLPTETDLVEDAGSSWYHHGKNYWTELFKRDAEYWSKFVRFVSWWTCAILIWSLFYG